MKQISYISVSSIFLSENSRITLLDVLFTVITWKTQQSISEFINRSRKTLPLLSGSFFFEMECVINQTLYTLKHQLDNLKFSLIFIKYSCFKRQSECKNVNVIKHHWPWYFLLQLFYNCIHFWNELLVGLKENICLLSWKIPLKINHFWNCTILFFTQCLNMQLGPWRSCYIESSFLDNLLYKTIKNLKLSQGITDVNSHVCITHQCPRLSC